VARAVARARARAVAVARAEGEGEGGPAEALRRTCGDAAGAAEAVLQQLEQCVLPEGVLAQSAVGHTHAIDRDVRSQGAARAQNVEGRAPARDEGGELGGHAAGRGATGGCHRGLRFGSHAARALLPAGSPRQSGVEWASGAVRGRVRRLRASALAMLGRRSTASEVEAPALHLLPLSAVAEM